MGRNQDDKAVIIKSMNINRFVGNSMVESVLVAGRCLGSDGFSGSSRGVSRIVNWGSGSKIENRV